MAQGPFTSAFDEPSRTLTVTGEIDDSSAGALRGELESRTAQYTRSVVVDLSGVSYLPSAAVGVLAAAEQRAASGGHALDLVAATGSIAQRVLAVCALPHRTG